MVQLRFFAWSCISIRPFWLFSRQTLGLRNQTADSEPAVFCYKSYNSIMKTKTGFSKEVISLIDKERILRIRAGADSTHKVIGIWAVVVNGRVYVRSYKSKPGGWWHTFLKDPKGEIFVAKRKRGIKIRAVQVK